MREQTVMNLLKEVKRDFSHRLHDGINGAAGSIVSDHESESEHNSERGSNENIEENICSSNCIYKKK